MPCCNVMSAQRTTWRLSGLTLHRVAPARGRTRPGSAGTSHTCMPIYAKGKAISVVARQPVRHGRNATQTHWDSEVGIRRSGARPSRFPFPVNLPSELAGFSPLASAALYSSSLSLVPLQGCIETGVAGNVMQRDDLLSLEIGRG